MSDGDEDQTIDVLTARGPHSEVGARSKDLSNVCGVDELNLVAITRPKSHVRTVEEVSTSASGTNSGN